MEPLLFTPFQIKNLHFKNRIVRSSIGGRTSFYDGTVTSAFKNFEKRFAEHDVAGIISATISVNQQRSSTMEYPKLSHDRYIKPLAAAIKAVHEFDGWYNLQIGIRVGLLIRVYGHSLVIQNLINTFHHETLYCFCFN